MKPTECVELVAFVASRCPAQRLEPTTADAWFVDLQRFELADAVEAARKISAGQPFVSLADLLREIREIRNDRVMRRAIEAPQGVPLPAVVRDAFRMPMAKVAPPDALERHVAMAQPCRFCGASPGSPCEIPSTGRTRATPHPLRGNPDQVAFPRGAA